MKKKININYVFDNERDKNGINEIKKHKSCKFIGFETNRYINNGTSSFEAKGKCK